MLGIVLRDVNTSIHLILKAAIHVDTIVPTLQIRRLRSKGAKIMGVRLDRQKMVALGFEPRHWGVWR